MKKLLLLLGFFAGAAHAQDEYYSLASPVTTVTGAPGNGPLTITGWIETDGFGKSGCVNNSCPGGGSGGGPYLDGPPFYYTTPIIAYQINLTYYGVTETMAGPEGGAVADYGVVATPKGLFCNTCGFWGAGFPWYDIGSSGHNGGGAFYQYEDTGAGGTVPGTLDFTSAYLKNNFRIGNRPTTTMPTTPGCPTEGPCTLAAAQVPVARATPELTAGGAGAALTLLIGMGLVFQGRRRG